MFTQLAGFAEFEREMIRERTMGGKRNLAEQGQQPSRAQHPYGYHIVTKEDVLRGEYDASQLGMYQILLFAFTQGDPEITAGLAKFWESHNALPAEEQPLAEVLPPSVMPGANDEGAQFLARATTVYQERNPGGDAC